MFRFALLLLISTPLWAIHPYANGAGTQYGAQYEVGDAMSNMVQDWNARHESEHWQQLEGGDQSLQNFSGPNFSGPDTSFNPLPAAPKPEYSQIVPSPLQQDQNIWSEPGQDEAFSGFSDRGWVPLNTEQGIWKGSNGETLFMRNGKIRMTGPGGAISEGVYMTYADRLIVYLAAEDAVRMYQYALRGGQMWVMDSRGNYVVFRRRPGMH